MYFRLYSKTKFNILTYHACCTSIHNRNSQTTSDTTKSSSSLPCGQGTPIAATDMQPPAQPDGITTSQALEATVRNTPEGKIPKSFNGERVKNSGKQATTSTRNTQDNQLCFRCKQPGHLKKDCPELPYCSKCRTRGPAKCPTKQQDYRWQNERC